VKKEIRVLCLEDAPADVVMLNHALRQGGFNFRLKRVETKEAFLHELAHQPPDLILSDHGLPTFDGFTALELAQDKYPEVPFIFVTSALGEEKTIETFERGASGYILKKDLSKLVPVVERALRRSEERKVLRIKEQQLQESEERYRRLIEFCPDAFLIVCDRQIEFANMAAAHLFGVENAEQIIGKSMQSVVHPDSWQALEQRMARLRENGTTFFWRRIAKGNFQSQSDRAGVFPFVESKFIRQDGSVLEVETAATPMTLRKRQAIQIIVRNITERKDTLEKLSRSEALKALILETALDAILFVNPEGRVQEWNRAAQRIFGYSHDEAVGQLMDELIIPPALRAAYHDGLTSYLMTGVGSLIGRPIELTLRRKGGGEFRAEIGVNRVVAEESPHCTVLIRDITERKQAEASLRESEERLRLLIENVKDYAIYMLDAQGNVVTWNAGADHVEGFGATEIIGKHLSTFFTPEEVARGVPQDALKRAERDGQALIEGWRVRKDGTRFWSQGVITALRDETGHLRGFSKIAHDITQQKEAEEKIRQLNEELEQRVNSRTAQLEAANKELEAFSYSVSHDLRSPLRHIAGYVEILQHEAAAKLDENSRQYLQTIADSAKNLGNLIDALLAFSRMGRADIRQQRVNLATLVEEARQGLSRDMEGRDIEWQIGALPEAQGDPLMLRQVIINLVSNALKYTRQRTHARIEIGATDSGNEIVFFIRDNGVGFDMKYMDKLFGVFQRLHSATEFEGIGIGLANVRRIVHRHGGRTGAVGKVNEGATFYFSIPKIPKERL
jgi:PAS domain S-box-containing protein